MTFTILRFLASQRKRVPKHMQFTSITHYNHSVFERSIAFPPEDSGNSLFLRKCQDVTVLAVNNEKRRQFRANELNT